MGGGRELFLARTADRRDGQRQGVPARGWSAITMLGIKFVAARCVYMMLPSLLVLGARAAPGGPHRPADGLPAGLDGDGGSSSPCCRRCTVSHCGGQGLCDCTATLRCRCLWRPKRCDPSSPPHHQLAQIELLKCWEGGSGTGTGRGRWSGSVCQGGRYVAVLPRGCVQEACDVTARQRGLALNLVACM